MLLNCGVGEDSCKFFGQQGDPTNPSQRKSALNIHWKDWCWSWNSQYFGHFMGRTDSFEKPWCWERLKAGGEGDNRGWNGWMTPPTQWTWVWVSSGSWWYIGKPGVLQSMGLQTDGHDWAIEMNWCITIVWVDLIWLFPYVKINFHPGTQWKETQATLDTGNRALNLEEWSRA